MCVYSLVLDHYEEKWRELLPKQPFTAPPPPYNKPLIPPEPPISDAEIREFRELLRKAREYDKKHNEPDCELESKKQRITALAEELGVKISFE